jgi:hypothetical protein
LATIAESYDTATRDWQWRAFLHSGQDRKSKHGNRSGEETLVQHFERPECIWIRDLVAEKGTAYRGSERAAQASSSPRSDHLSFPTIILHKLAPLKRQVAAQDTQNGTHVRQRPLISNAKARTDSENNTDNFYAQCVDPDRANVIDTVQKAHDLSNAGSLSFRLHKYGQECCD